MMKVEKGGDVGGGGEKEARRRVDRHGKGSRGSR